MVHVGVSQHHPHFVVVKLIFYVDKKQFPFVKIWLYVPVIRYPLINILKYF
jgi:hypothetical protein